MRRYAAFTAHEKPTTGDVKMSFVNQDHLGWLLCNGRALSVSEYGILFNVVGYTFGGSGDTFYLPDVSGVVPGVAGPTHAIGTQVGTETHTLTIAEMPGHTHGAVDVSGNTNGSGFTGISGEHVHNIVTQNDDFNFSSGNWPSNTSPQAGMFSAGSAKDSGLMSWPNGTNAVGAHAHAVGSTGGSQPHNNMQPTYFIGNMFIYSGDPPAGTWPYTIPPGGGQPTIY